MSVHRFCAFHFPAFHIWTRDIDRSAPPALLQAIANDVELPLARVAAMTLRDMEQVVSIRRPRGTAAWINVLGVYHRIRRSHGLQYCPMCLADTYAYRQAWRLSCVVHCDAHQCLLRDACPRCDAPVIPHRQLPGALRCHICHRPLASTPPHVAPPDAAVARQDACLHALASGFGLVGKRRVSAQAYFRGLRILTSAVAGQGCGAGESRIRDSRCLERMRTAARAGLLAELDPILTGWPSAFRDLATDRHWTQRTFHRARVPMWLCCEVRRLPRGRARCATSPRSMRAKLAILGKRQPPGWRSQRAALLLAAARGRRP